MIQVNEITKAYRYRPGVLVLKGVSFHIAKGEFVAIMGRSGSGKTTLLNILGTLDQPSSGSVIVNDIEITRLNEKGKANFRRNQIGFVFQLFNLIPQSTVLENVLLPLQPYRRGLSFDLEKRAKEVIHWVGLDQRLNVYPDYLSGGEQQRLALARALINRPKIILADEPTGNLDADTGSGIVNLLHRLNSDLEMTVLIVTHNEDIAMKTDRILYLSRGVINETSS